MVGGKVQEELRVSGDVMGDSLVCRGSGWVLSLVLLVALNRLGPFFVFVYFPENARSPRQPKRETRCQASDRWGNEPSTLSQINPNHKTIAIRNQGKHGWPCPQSTSKALVAWASFLQFLP